MTTKVFSLSDRGLHRSNDATPEPKILGVPTSCLPDPNGWKRVQHVVAEIGLPRCPPACEKSLRLVLSEVQVIRAFLTRLLVTETSQQKGGGKNESQKELTKEEPPQLLTASS